MTITIPEGYEALGAILQRALDQAATGKGKERHANDLPFDRQPMQVISQLIGSGAGLTYQAVKKLQEAERLPTAERRTAERLGAINYIAGSIIYDEGENNA